MQEKILFVDDEPQVLEGFRRLLGGSFQIETANSGSEAVEKLKKNKAIAVTVCDMRMPGMDGAHLLQKIRIDFPDVVRVMLTGNTDQQTAIQAVNDGQIFRFLTKPCTKDVLIAALHAALIQHRVTSSKEELLDRARYGHRLEPWTADPSSAVFREVEGKVRELVGPEARTYQPSDGGMYLGSVVWLCLDYMVQSISSAQAIVHPRNLLTNTPKVGEVVRIEYTNGSGEVTLVRNRRA